MHHTFTTPEPISLVVELGPGRLDVDASDTSDTTEIRIEGDHADEVTVEQRGHEIVVLAPQRRTGFLSSLVTGDLKVQVVMPAGSDLAAKVGSADVTASGRYADLRVKAGSGDVEVDEVSGSAVVDTGSGDIELTTASGDLRIKAGSGDVSIGRVAGSAVVSTGSGTVELGTVGAQAVLKTGSGDIRIHDAHTDLSAMTGSGDVYVAQLSRGGLRAKAASGDINIGVPAGIPVWTDISCLTGNVRSNLEGAGRPEEGQDHVEIRATTVSGNITLAQL
jgi:DUF4097 and DUF4098 domain-containing protein YvlB